MAAAPSQRESFKLDGGARILAVALLCSTSLVAIDRRQPITHMHHTAWSGKEGVIGAVLSIAQTTDGFIWLGTTGGLLRFDGAVLERYRPEQGSFQEIWVSALLATSDGGLWIGYLSGGVSFLKQGRATNYTNKQGVPAGRVRNFAQDVEGTVWCAATGGLGYFDGRQWQYDTKHSNPWDFRSNSPSSVAVDRRGDLWLVAKNGVFVLPSGAPEFQKVTPGPAPGYLPTFTETSEDEMSLWNPDSLSLQRFRGRTSDRNFPLKGISNSAGMFLVDHDGSGWMMTRREGIWRIPVAKTMKGQVSAHDPSIERFNEKDGLTNDTVYCVMEDREGNVWVGTQGGLDRFRRRNAVWTQLQSASTKRMQLVAGNAGDVWASSPEALRDARNGKPVPGSPPGIQFAFKDPDGAIWFWTEHGTSGGLWRWTGRQFVKIEMPVLGMTTPRDRLADSWVPLNGPVRALTRDASGALWLSIRGRGVFHQHDGVWSRIDLLDGERYTTAYGALRDDGGRVWLAFPERRKIAQWDRGEAHVFSADTGLDIGPITQIASFEGHVLAGGEAGLAIYSNGRFHTVETADGAELGTVLGIAGTSKSGLWLSTAAELIHIPENEVALFVQDWRHKVHYERIDPVSDRGERPSDTSDTPAVMGTDGILWFATQRGVIRVDPANLHRNRVPPLAAIRSASVNGKPYSVYAPFTLPPHSANLRIGYSVLSFSVPERVRSRYRLLQFEQEWHEAGGRVEARYDSLGPGTYTFQVAACNDGGVWNEAGASLDFTVQPAFHQTIWFQLSYVPTGGFLIWLLYRLRLRQVTARVRFRYAERLAERTRIARELHDTLLQSLAGVSLQLEGIAKQAASRPERLASLVDQVREEVDACFLEARAKVWSLRSTSLEGPGFAATLREFCERIGTLTAAHCEFQLVGEPQPVQSDLEEELLRIAQEAVHNAVRHARANGILLKLEYAKRWLTLVVSDDGRGFDVEAGLRKSDHWGLKNMQERAAQIHAIYSITSDPESGTKIEVRAPIPG